MHHNTLWPCDICFCVLQCTLLVTSLTDDKAADSYKCRTALKYGVPVVSTYFLHQCVQEGKFLDPDIFRVAGQTKADQLKAGKIGGKIWHIFIEQYFIDYIQSISYIDMIILNIKCKINTLQECVLFCFIKSSPYETEFSLI